MTLLLLWACGADPVQAPAVEGWTEEQRRRLTEMKWDGKVRSDPTNRFVGNPKAEELGSRLFFDKGLSGTGQHDCGTCHIPALNFTDGLKRSRGVGEAVRHTPAIPGSQLGAWFFWDGRADSLWAQAAGPMEDVHEMGGDRLSIVRHVTTTYPDRWAELFGEAPDLTGLPERAAPVDGALGVAWTALPGDDKLKVDQAFVNVLKAIAAYEATLLPQRSPFDDYLDDVLAGGDGGGALTPEAERGLKLFVGRANCVSCHHGPMLTDRAFHNLGLAEDQTGYDQGRTVGAMKVRASGFNCAGPHSDAKDCPELDYLNPTFDDFISAFKTPSLREVARTAPYMHNGLFATLDEVLDFYDQLPTKPLAGHRELTLKPLGLAPHEKAELKAFLEALSGGPIPDEVVHR